MKAHYRTKNGQITFELEGQTAKELFRDLSSVQEVFDVEQKCGMCGSEEIRFLARTVDKFDFYELSCQSCRARFAFGQSLDKMSLFPKRKDGDGNWIPNGGWTKWEGRGESHTEAVGAPPSRYQEPAAPSHHPEPPGEAPPRYTTSISRGSDFRRELPKELAANFSRIQKDRSQFASVCLKLEENMMCRDSRRGQEAYDSVLRAVDRKFPNGIREVSDMREVLIDLWEAAESLGEVSAGRGFGV